MSNSTTRSSDEQTADGIIANRTAILCGVMIISDGTNDPTVILYDNTAASGAKLFERSVDVSVEGFGSYIELPCVKADNGIYLDITGTGASCIVYYK